MRTAFAVWLAGMSVSSGAAAAEFLDGSAIRVTYGGSQGLWYDATEDRGLELWDSGVSRWRDIISPGQVGEGIAWSYTRGGTEYRYGVASHNLPSTGTTQATLRSTEIRRDTASEKFILHTYRDGDLEVRKW